MSSGVPVRTGFPSVVAAPAGPAVTEPKAPNRTLPSERPIASLISVVSSVPDAPTSVPATIRAKFPRTNPLAATARPVNAFSREITTGMSAPPIGNTNATPRTSPRIRSGTKMIGIDEIAIRYTASATIASASAPLTICWPG